MTNKNREFVVYTVLTGHKEELQNPFPKNSSGYERICFTDNPNLKSDYWTIVLMDDQHLDSVREYNRYKLLPHRFLPDFDWSLYFDNTVYLKTEPLIIWEKYSHSKSSFICFKHPWRDCLYQEGEAVIAVGYDDEARIREQLEFYQQKGFPSHSGLIATTMLLRNHNHPKLIEMQEIWFNHVLRFSKRNQISYPFVAWQKNFQCDYFDGSLIDNDLMDWQVPKQTIHRLPRDFKEDIYVWRNPEVAQSGMSPQEHYLKIGLEKKLPYRTHHWELNRLANKYKTDKGTLYYNRHGYAAVYEQYLAPYKKAPINLLELGLLRHDVQARNPNGPYDDVPSLKMWREYFSEANIIGFDIADFSTAPPLDQVKIIQGDMSKISDLSRLNQECPDGFDVIIDDASHASHHQQIALDYLFKHLKEGGLYFIEDLHYQPPSLEVKGIIKTKDILKALAIGRLIETDFLNQDTLKYLRENIDFIRFYDSQDRQFGSIFADALVVIKKKEKNNLSSQIQDVMNFNQIAQDNYGIIDSSLRVINVIAFPDWNQREDDLNKVLSTLIEQFFKHPDKDDMCLLIESNNISEEDANLILSAVLMNLFLEKGIEIENEPEICFVRDLTDKQWQMLIARLQYHIVLEKENPQLPIKDLSLNKIKLKDNQKSLWEINKPSSLKHYKDKIIELVKGSPGQLSREEYSYIVDIITNKTPCNFLVFGLGKDSNLWLQANSNGKTVFLEHDVNWFNEITNTSPEIEAYLVDYKTQRKDWLNLLREYNQGLNSLSMTIPEEILAEQWDCIFVDAPTGYADETPGRMKSIYLASQLAYKHKSTDIFIHDCDRLVENIYAGYFLHQENMITQVNRLKHYRICY